MKLLMLSACLVASSVCAVALSPRLPHGAAVAASSIPLGMAAVVPAALWIRHRSRRRAMAGRDILRIDDLPTIEGRVYLGRGFEWTPDHATELAKESSDGRGPEALHGVGATDERDLCISERELDHHLLLLGTTGVGKTRMMEILITQALRRGDAVAVIDPKGDSGLLARVIDECRKRKVCPSLVAPPYPRSSSAYNPIARFREPREIADRIAALLPQGGDAEPFRNFAWEIVESTAAVMHRYGILMSLANLRRFAIENPWMLPRRVMASIEPDLAKLEPEKMAHRFLARPSTDHPELRNLLSLNLRPREHAQKLASALVPILSQLTSGSLRDLLSPPAGGFSWERLDRERGVAYFFLGSLLGADSAHAVARLALLDFQSYVGARYASGSPARPMSIFVDEMADVVSPAFIHLINKGRGAGIRVTACAQTLADLESALGSEAQARQVIGNVNTVLQFRAPGAEEAAAFSNLAGTRLLPTVTDGESYEPALFGSGLKSADDFRAVFGRQTSWTAQELVPPWAVGGLPRFEFFVRSGGQIAKGIAPLLPPAPPEPVRKIQEVYDAADGNGHDSVRGGGDGGMVGTAGGCG